MNATRIEPRVHCHKRPLHGGYVNAAATTPNYLREVFEAERARIEAAVEGLTPYVTAGSWLRREAVLAAIRGEEA